MDQLIKYGDIKRGKIGVSIEDVALDEVAKLGVAGVKVRGIESGSAAERAGIAVNDVIVTFNGANVRSVRDLVNKVGLTRAGNTVQLSVLRNGKRQSIDVKVGDATAL
jgi:serine protease Do/serine protease DegQ